MKILLTLSLILLAVANIHAIDDLKNANFLEWKDGKPSNWTIRSGQPLSIDSKEGGLKVDIAKAERGYGEILQKLPVEQGKRYQLTGKLKGSKPSLAFYQIKRFRDGKEIGRISSARNEGTDWVEVNKIFQSDQADQIAVLLRWQQKGEDAGQSIAFTDVSIEELPPYSNQAESVAPYAVPTFNSVGLYWKPKGGTADRSVTTHYRKQGDSEWKEALPLWFDATEHQGNAFEHTGEYRGSIVYLEPGTKYEARLQLANGPEEIVKFSTWSEDFKIARKVALPAKHEGTYEITEGGNETDGYVLYEAADGEEVVWDANNAVVANIEVNASWVIIRGLTLKGAKNHGIVLNDVNHIVIEDCDISGWGENYESGQARNLNSAIYSKSKQLEHVVIQNCDLHHPRTDSNSWAEQRPGTKSRHPEGPQGISLRSGKGQFVIRYNRIYSDMDHMFNDGMGDTKNFGYAGFPTRDSDINDNFVSHCWDDALEIEGADMNVRVWNNYLDMSYGAIGAAAPSLGPVYFFRNVYGVSRKHSGMAPNDLRGHYLVKLGNKNAHLTRGRMFILHNTTLQPPPFEGSDLKSSGAQSGIVFTDNRNLQENITTRNNILQMRGPDNWVILDRQITFSNDYDYDLYDGRTKFREGSETNAVIGNPVYDRAPDGRLWPAAGSPGHDAAERIPNFNDLYTGEAPDMGAVERNSKQPKPKHWPDFPENYSPAPVVEQQATN